MSIKEDDLALCTVKRIEGTTVFVTIEDNGEGSIVMSEVAAGRIRNLREHVAQNKKIVCKVLKISNGHPQLSLRRVTAKEREIVEEQHRKTRTLIALLRTIVENAEAILAKIKARYTIGEFFEHVKAKPSIVNEFLKKEHAESLLKLLSEKEEREKEVKRIFTLKSTSDAGSNEIKAVLAIDANIKYLGSSKFSVETKGKDFKEANLKVTHLIQQIEQRARERKVQFELKEVKQ